jgi:hypothetical protein
MEVGMQGVWGRGRWIAICALVAPFVFGASAYAAEPPLLTQVTAMAVSQTAATLKAKINPSKKTTTYSFEYGLEDCETSSCTQAGSGSVSVPSTEEVTLEGLNPGTLYHYRVTAENADGKANSGDRVFATRSGIFSGLPDGRAYEQASPTDKDGGDLQGYIPLIKAAESGGGITFESTFGVPGGKGAQEFPTYFASRGESSWSSEGLLPPFSAGQRAQVIGWSPDLTEVFSQVTRLGEPRAAALVVQSGSVDPVTIAPYTPGGDGGAGAEYFYAGQSADGSVVVFESLSKLTAEARAGLPNVYAWDRETGNLTLAGTYNDGTSPLRGTLAGAYWWVAGTGGRYLSLGGAERSMYLRDEHAISPDGSVVFTEAGTGQLYRRINPTAEQSPLNGQGKCEDPAKACTIHISASHKTDGKGEGNTDAAGPQAAAFQAASKDGSEVFFTSPEKLTNDANTGPEQSPAQIEEGSTTGAIENEKLVAPQRALGVAVDGSHLYWVNPTTQAIDRSDLSGNNKVPAFIVPGSIECEIKGSNPPKFEEVESTPRYLAVQGKYLYWTNTGCSDEFGPLGGTGTIGRADINGASATDIDPAFIEGASNPQGIAVDSEHIYWANAGRSEGVRGIGWATIEGEEVDQELIKSTGNEVPNGVALSGSYVYFGSNEGGSGETAYIIRFTVEGEEEKFVGVGKKPVGGVAVDSEHVYWATQGEEAIGRANLELELASREKKFISLEGKPTGIAAEGTHLYWSTNGESPTNPGNDLYRYGPKEGELEDLTVDSSGNGAEVQGVLGASADGKYVYFAANGILDDAEAAEQGDCKSRPLGSASGNCSLYLWHDGATSLIARLVVGDGEFSDALNWTATPRELFGSTSYVPKSSFVSADGQTLLFRSQEQLTDYSNEEVLELYRFRVGDPEGIRCVSCNPAGEGPGEGPGFGRLHFPALGPLPSVMSVSARVLSADGNKAFFETTESLVPEDTNAQDGCENVGKGEQLYFSCIDTYQWEAPGTPGGSCSESSPAYSPINAGCVYLLSTGKSKYPSLFADASASGDDVFFFTRDQLVGQDKDEIQDVYDARVGGGLASQNPVATVPCEGAESCHGAAPPVPVESAPATPNFHGPINPKPVHKKQKQKHKHKAKKHKKKTHTKQKRATTQGRNAR